MTINKIMYLLLSISISNSHAAAVDWWWNTPAPKNNNTTLSIKAGNTGAATKSIAINPTTNSNTLYSNQGSMPYVIVQNSTPTMKRTRVIFTASGRWAPPPTLTSAKVFIISGGGGGQGGHTDSINYWGGNGGGAGQIIESSLTLGGVSAGTYCNVTVGAGGTGGTTGGNSGGVGGDSIVQCFWGGSSRVTKLAYGGAPGTAQSPGAGSANGGGGDIDTSSMSTTLPAVYSWICRNGSYQDTEAIGGWNCKTTRGAEGSRGLYINNGNTRNVSGGGGGGYFGTAPNSTIGESDGTTILSTASNTMPWGLGGKGYFGKGGDGGYGGSAFATTSGPTGIDTQALPSYQPAKGYGAGGNGGAYFNGSGVQISSAGGGGGGFLGFPGVPTPPVQTVTNGVGVAGTQGIVIFEY